MQLGLPRKIPRHFSEMLREEFQNRAIKNSSYSMRAFARDLGLSSGHLSDLLNLKVGISINKVELISQKINFSIEDQKLFLKLAENSLSPEDAPVKLYNYDSSYVTIADDYYVVLTDWYHFALVELVKVVGFKNEDAWIAERLGLSIEMVRPIVERLLRVELLEEKENELFQTYDYFVSPSGTPLDAAKKFHKEVLEKAIVAIDTQEIEERNYTSGFLRVRTEDLPMVASRIKDFRRTLAHDLEAGDGHDSVYAFSIQFFRGDFKTV